MIDRLFHCRVTTVTPIMEAADSQPKKRLFPYQQTSSKQREPQLKPAFQIEARYNLNFNKAPL